MVKLCESLAQSFQINNSNGGGYGLREQYIAERAKWILSNGNDTTDTNKGFLWTHNEHVNYSTISIWHTGKTRFTLGGLIREKFGNEVYTIGMDFNKTMAFHNCRQFCKFFVK